MQRRTWFYLAIPVSAFVVVVALGIYSLQKQKTSNTSAFGISQTTEEQPFLPSEEAEDQNSEQVKLDKLRQAVIRFREATALRSYLEQETSEGKVTADLEYVKPLRLHAKITLPSKSQEEVIIVGESVYTYVSGKEWNLVNDQVLKDFGQKFFTSMSSSDKTLQSFGVNPDAQFHISQDKSKKCTVYATQYSVENSKYDISFCINDNLDMVYIHSQGPDGELNSSYFDINKLITIERPVLPWLERNFELKQANSD